VKVEIWSDVVCPWCYIGKCRFETALAAFPHKDSVEVIHRSFELDPTMPMGPGGTVKTVDMLARKYRTTPEQARAMMTHVEQTAAEVGLEYHLAGTLSGNTVDAHRVIHLARTRGLQDKAIERLYRAYFTEGLSIFDHDSLVRLASEVGLAPAEVRQTLESGAYEDEVRHDEAEAHQIGVNGVPFFVIDERYGISGAQPAELFSQALNQAWNERSPAQQLVSSDAAASAAQ
jgi:predicted DsbA family dithiol-disulfide isomerase